MRVIGGTLKGRALKAPSSHDIRPSSDRLRESLFNILAHSYENVCEDARVLDLFSGTGALAIEALSRGAKLAALVDMGIEARGIIRTNLDTLSLGGVAKLLKRDATKLGAVTTYQPFTLVFCDPPYNRGLAEMALISAQNGGWLAENALIIVEEASKAGFIAPEGFTLLETRAMGETVLYFLTILPLRVSLP
jgi:16S rRNA (guanine966-N2)-methyltransferase